MTFRQILASVGASCASNFKARSLMSMVRTGMDALQPGLLDKQVGVKLIRDTSAVALFVDGKCVGMMENCEVIDRGETTDSRKVAEIDRGPVLGSADLAGQAVG